MTSRPPLAAALAVALLALAAAAAALPPAAARAQTPPGELVDRAAFRVCADPDDLPFSNEAREGFENKIAALMAGRLGLPVEYSWHPQSVGFVRNTLRARTCDIIMGVVAADELVQNTNPYYRSAYVMVVREEDKGRLNSLRAQDAAQARFGVIAGTPPSDLLARYGLIGRTQPYNLVVDTRVEKPARQMLEDLRTGAIDVALLWGPIAGYWIKREALPFAMFPLASDAQARVRLDFRISMGIRQGEPEWKLRVNNLIRELQPEIDRILLEYGVPLLDEQGRLVGAAAPPAAAQAAAAAPGGVPEPEGYRTDRYRAPVPTTLKGATVLDTRALQALLAGPDRPVLVDVLPRQAKPKDRDASQLWIEPKREHIPGSAWLPNTGYGELGPDYRAYFERELARLTGGDKARPVVFYCDKNCWMSWNAAKRAMAELGYTRVHWYPDGAQGWKEAGLELAQAEPVPPPEASQ
jgi:quinoprotein dehydrogenase-associated probable ABC transporter substrate-binding protein/PQQ-dependent catabolism-associated CXXCW motif protein